MILCPQLPENCSFVVVDYLRPHLPICAGDVPYYPEKGEMVIIKGTSDETWLGHIQSVDYACKTCKVYFYVENRNSGIYMRESPHAREMDTALWARILTAAQGRCDGKAENGIQTDINYVVSGVMLTCIRLTQDKIAN